MWLDFLLFMKAAKGLLQQWMGLIVTRETQRDHQMLP